LRQNSQLDLQEQEGAALWVANLTAYRQTVTLGGLRGTAFAGVLDESILGIVKAVEENILGTGGLRSLVPVPE